MASDNDSDNSCGTIAMEDDSFFNSVLGPDKLNLSLYQFDEKKEFSEDKNNTLRTFKDFSKRTITEFTGLSLLSFLKKWSTKLKCYQIISDIENQQNTKARREKSFIFKFNGLDIKSTKRNNVLKATHKKLTNFYAEIFSMSKSDQNLIDSLWSFRTFYITFNNAAEDVEKIISAVTFDCDKQKGDVYIYWIGTALALSKNETQLPFFDAMNGTFQRIGLSSFLIQAIIKYCSIDSEKETTIYLQCSTNRAFAVSFYRKNGFYNKGNKMQLIPESIKPKEKYFIQEEQISLMICNHGYFQRKLPPVPNINRDEEYKADLKKAIELSLPPKPTIKLTEDKRMKLIKRVMNIEPKFDHVEYLKSSEIPHGKKHYPIGGEFDQIRAKTFLLYPPSKAAIEKHGKLDKYTIDTVVNSFPILRNYIITNKDSEDLYGNTILGQSILHVVQQAEFYKKKYLSWELMSIFLNIYSQYNNIDNVAVIPPFVSAYAKNLRDCRLKIKVLTLKLQAIENDEEKMKIENEIKDNRLRSVVLHQGILSGIPKAIRNKLFEKRLIIFVTNPGMYHWCCTFIFNLRQYIINLENDTSVLPNEDTFEISGYFEFDPLKMPTNYRNATDKEGLFEFLYVVYENLWNRTKPKEERTTTNPIDFKKMIMMENSGFYQMKCESFFIAKQHDGYNCSLGIMLAMLRFMNAFNDNIVSKEWIATKEKISKAVIPSYIFAPIEYNICDRNHLDYIRNEVFNSIDTLSEILCDWYKEARLNNCQLI